MITLHEATAEIEEYNPELILRNVDEQERFWSKTAAAQNACIAWTAGFTASGYGAFTLRGRMVYAHRVAVVAAGRHIPPGFDCDHNCEVRWCVNPYHIDVLSRSAHLQRGAATTTGAHRGSASQWRGVRLDIQPGRTPMWEAQTRDRDGAPTYLGKFNCELDAAIAVIVYRMEQGISSDKDRNSSELTASARWSHAPHPGFTCGLPDGVDGASCAPVAAKQSGHKYVNWHTARSKWQVAIKIDGRTRHIGSFDTIPEAVAARDIWRFEHGMEPAGDDGMSTQ